MQCPFKIAYVLPCRSLFTGTPHRVYPIDFKIFSNAGTNEPDRNRRSLHARALALASYLKEIFREKLKQPRRIPDDCIRQFILYEPRVCTCFFVLSRKISFSQTLFFFYLLAVHPGGRRGHRVFEPETREEKTESMNTFLAITVG